MSILKEKAPPSPPEDKKIGEYWRRCQEYEIIEAREVVMSLILKLVKERQAIYLTASRTSEEALQKALRDFGIRRDEWPG